MCFPMHERKDALELIKAQCAIRTKNILVDDYVIDMYELKDQREQDEHVWFIDGQEMTPDLMAALREEALKRKHSNLLD